MGVFTDPRRPKSEQWHALLGQLNSGAGDLDASAQSQLSELNKRTESLRKGRSLLRDDEFESAMDSIHKDAVQYPWEHHLKPPGSNPGDVIEQDGIKKIRTSDGTLEPMAFTAEYIKENTIPLGDTGQVAVPISPRDGHKVVAAAKRDPSFEQQQIGRAADEIRKRYELIQKQYLPSKEVKDKAGKVVGSLPFTKAERDYMSAQAADSYLMEQMQAKNVVKTLMDGGGSAVSAIGGDAKDPFKQNIRQRQMQEEVLLREAANRDAVRDILPQPSPSPIPEGSQVHHLLPQSEDDWSVLLDKEVEGKSLDELFSKKTKEQKDIEEATVPATGGFSSKLVSAASGQIRPLEAATKDDMNTRFKEAPEGVVVELADGRRYIKDDGKFWQVPWSRKQIESQVMLDPSGKPIIDPSTKKPAIGIVKQLEQKKQSLIEPQAMLEGREAMGLPPAVADESVQDTQTPLLPPRAPDGIRETMAPGQRLDQAKSQLPQAPTAASNLPTIDVGQSTLAIQTDKKASDARVEQLKKELSGGQYQKFLDALRTKRTATREQLQSENLPLNTPFLTEKGGMVIKRPDGSFDYWAPGEFEGPIRQVGKQRTRESYIRALKNRPF